MDFAVELGRSVRQARRRYRLTQQQLADLVRISDKTLRDIERGRPGPSFASAVAAAEAVGLELSIR